MSLSLDVEYGVLAKQNLGNGYVNAIKLSSNLEKIVSAINDISSAVKTNIVVRSVNDQLPQNETNDINLNILRPDKNETDVYKEILSSESQFMQESSEVSFQATEIGKKELQAGKNKIQSILVDDNKILAGSNGNGIFYSEDNGETFEQATGLEGQYVKVIKKFFGKYFAGTGNSVYQSTDGKNWTIFTVKVSKNIYQIEESVNDLLQVKYGNRKILIVATDNGVVATTNSYAKKTLISGTAYALTKDDKDNVYFSANGNIYVISIENINNYLIVNYLTAADIKKTTEENSEIQESDLHAFKFGSNVYDMLIKDETLFAAVSYTVEDNSRIRSITTKYGIKKAHLSDLSQQSFTSIYGIGQKISYLKTNGYGIYTQIKNGNYPTFWFTTNGQDFTSYQTKLNDDISEFDFIDNFTMVAGANGGIIKFKQTADYIRDKLITERDLSANNSQLCTYIDKRDTETYTSANNYTDKEINKLKNTLENTINNGIEGIKNVTLTSYEQISTFNQNYISLGKDTYGNSANKQNNNVAIGQKVAVTANDSIGLGQNITADGSYNIAVGNNLSTSSSNAIAIGYNLSSFPNTGNHSIAIGYNTAALCADSIAIGRMISTETTSTTKIGAAFGNTITGDNAETIALELSAKIKDDENATSESKAYITVNRFTKNTGTWSETKKEISLKGHTHAISDIIGLSDEFTSHNNKINYISSYVSAIPGNVEQVSNDLISLSNQTKTISTSLCSEISDLSTDIDNQKVTVFSDLSAYVDDVLSSDTVNFPTAAAITQWSDKRYLRSVGFDDPTATLRLLSSMLTPGNLVLYIDADNGNDDNDGSQTNPLKTITKAIKIANQQRFIAGSQIFLYLKGTFNVRHEANLYKNDNSGIVNEDKELDISDPNTIFKSSYGLKIYHPDMKAPSYMRILKWLDNDATIEVDLKKTLKFQTAIHIYCDTIFKGIKFDAKTDVKIYDPDRFLSAFSSDPDGYWYKDYTNTITATPYLIDVKYSKTNTPYTYYNYNTINESGIVSKFTADVLDFYDCSCYNFMTAFGKPTHIINCYFENGRTCIENSLNSTTELDGLSCKNVTGAYNLWLNGITHFSNAENFNSSLYFENINTFSSRSKAGYTLFFNLFFDFVKYYNSNTLTLLDTLNNNVVNRITDTFNIYNYCTSASAEYRVQNGTLVSATIENNHKTIDYIDFLYKFLFNSESVGNNISSKYASYNKDKYNGIITFNCGDYATSSIIYVPLSVLDPINEITSERSICYFPFLEQLFNIIREEDKTLTSQYDGIQYSTTYHAYKISDIVHLDNDNNKISSIDYTKFTISAYKDLFDSIY